MKIPVTSKENPLKSIYEMTDKEFNRWIKNASSAKLSAAFCKGKTHEQIEKDIAVVEALGA
jgi:hypothetical protein